MSGIVVGVDGSSGSQQALDWAVREAAIRQSPLTVLTVHEVVRSQWTGDPVTSAADQPELERAQQAANEAAVKVTSQLGDTKPASVTVRAVNGLAAGELIAASQDADLLVVGSRGGGGFASLLVGSVTFQVVLHAECPVVVVRQHQ